MKIKRVLPVFFAILALQCFASAHAANEDHISIPDDGHKLLDFLPHGWEIESTTSGDLDGDGQAEVILVGIEAPGKSPSKDWMGERVLVVLKKRPDDSFTKISESQAVLWCKECYGTLADAAAGGSPKIQVRKGVMVISQSGGGGSATDSILKFRLDSQKSRFQLIGKDTVERERATGNVSKQSINFLTGTAQVTEVRFDEAGKESITRRHEKVTESAQCLETFDWE